MNIFSRMIDKEHHEAAASDFTDYVTCKICHTTTVGNPANNLCFRCHDDPRRMCGHITELEAEVERLTKPDCGWVLQGDYAETGCGQEVALINEDMSWVAYCPYCGCPVIEESYDA